LFSKIEQLRQLSSEWKIDFEHVDIQNWAALSTKSKITDQWIKI